MIRILKKLQPYIAIARFDHWVKNIFIIPGFVFAFFFDPKSAEPLQILIHLVIALLAAGFVASANYILNEYLDRDSDRQHPIKKNRYAANNKVRGPLVFLEYILLLLIGLGLASLIGVDFLIVAILLIAMGVLYNIAPIRLKDWPYLDVLSESVNNPLRFLLGWFALQQAHILPPSSILLAYWMGGAYLMAVKRYSELRQINNPARASSYRKSFGFYTPEKLLVSALFYGTLSTLFLGVFLIKYRIEYIITAPLFALLFSWYLQIGLRSNSAAVAPEKLYKEYKFILYIIVVTGVFLALTFIDIPQLNILLQPVRIVDAP